VNLPAEATVEDVEDVYFQGWKMGLKALAIYRNNSKVGQPLQSKKDSERTADAEEVGEVARLTRKRLPKRRTSKTTSFAVAGAEGYMTAGEYEDGTVGEVFIKMSKQGSTLAGVMDAFSISISIGLQYGVPLEAFVSKYINMRFDPAGLTDDADVRMAQSVMDYLFRRLALDYLPYDVRSEFGIFTAEERAATVAAGYGAPAVPAADDVDVEGLAQGVPVETHVDVDVPRVGSSTELLEAMQGTSADAPLCMTCGTKMRPAGSCYVCEGCGSTSGCS
jgi:ribonucleoside-diphosphate reductase alpha chain